MLGLLVAAQAVAAACRRSAACRLLPLRPTTLLPPCRRMGDPALADPDRFALAAVQQYLHEQGFERGARMPRLAAQQRMPLLAIAQPGCCNPVNLIPPTCAQPWRRWSRRRGCACGTRRRAAASCCRYEAGVARKGHAAAPQQAAG